MEDCRVPLGLAMTLFEFISSSFSVGNEIANPTILKVSN